MRIGKSEKKGVWKKVVIVLITGILTIGLLAYSRRHTIIVWYLQANKEIQKMVIDEMLEEAKPIIERQLQMSLVEKIYSHAAGDRNETERQTDALVDVRLFVELGFQNQWIRFKDVHKLNSINNIPLNGFEFALDWNQGNTEEVLVAFNIRYLKRKIDKMQVNDNCSFFTELKSYVGTEARKN